MQLTETAKILKTSFFGRRSGKSLSPTQQQYFKTILPKYLIDINIIKKTEDIYQLFPNKNLQKLHLEIGFGAGEYLRHHAALKQNTGFIGVEPFISSMAKMLKYFSDENTAPQNIILYNDDAAHLLEKLPSESLDSIDIFYPDPWNKSRHHKRRFINNVNLKQILRILKPKSYFRFASDIINYTEWTIQHCKNFPEFQCLTPTEQEWQKPYENWITTRYEQKAIKAQRKPCYLKFLVK